jgi:Kef-type K+ transport system membrane component KefB
MISGHSIEYSMFLIFTGAALLTTLALFARQAMIVGYIVLGVLLGPWGLALISDAGLIQDISNIGIIFLLYLLGLDLLPQQLLHMLGEALRITLASSTVFLLGMFLITWFFGFNVIDAVLIGTALMFSSTIIGLKLLPTTILHHRHTGQIIISVLLIQDLIAIVVLLLMEGYGKGVDLIVDMSLQVATLPLLIAIAFLLERYLLIKLIQKFDRIHEYIFLLAIAWCMGIAELAGQLGLSHEIGAFVAGVTLASSPIALFITERLKPLRDFFLIIFFFSMGAGFNIGSVHAIIIPAILLALFVILAKPAVFSYLLANTGEKVQTSREVGFRLGQASEFSLLIAALAVKSSIAGPNAADLIQLTTLITFIVSSYIIVLNYPTPIAVTERLRRD